MEKFTVEGLVLKTTVTGESDRIVFVLTSSRGIIRAFAKGARNLKSRFHSATELFAYCTFTFSENKGVYNLSEAVIKELFFGLRNELDRLSLAQYFCEVMLKTVPDAHSDGDFLRLILNSIWLTADAKKPLMLIKSVFEMRNVCIGGYMPALVACDTCGCFESENMYFNCRNGLLYCETCGAEMNLPRLPFSVIQAMRHIVFSDFGHIFSFELSNDALILLNRMTGCYIENCYQQKFKTLEYLQF